MATNQVYSQPLHPSRDTSGMASKKTRGSSTRRLVQRRNGDWPPNQHPRDSKRWLVSPYFLLFRISSHLISFTINQSFNTGRDKPWSLVALYLSPKISFLDHPS